MRVKDSMEVEDPSGHQIAMVKKAMITPARPLDSQNQGRTRSGGTGQCPGPRVHHRRGPGQGSRGIQESFRVRDTYGVEIEPGQDDVLILAVTACIDQMAQ